MCILKECEVVVQACGRWRMCWMQRTTTVEADQSLSPTLCPLRFGTSQEC